MLRSRLLDDLDSIAHGFSTKLGGVSTGPLSSLNLARRPGEDDEALRENWRRASAACGLTPDDLVLLSQVHGARVLTVETPSGCLAVAGEADALVTTRPGLLLAVRAADCVPILLAGHGGVAAVHSGWRGTAANVIAATVSALCAASGARPDQLSAAVGPHISAACYEVGDEVPAGLTRAGLDPDRFLSRGANGKAHVDLGAAIRQQLEEAGVSRVESLGICTHSDRRLYSHRGEGPATGRHAALIALKAT